VHEVARFRQDIQNYFRSSYFRQPGLVPRNLMGVAFHISNGLPLTEPVTAFKFPSIHPLFSQVVLELQLELYSIDEEISAEQLGERMTGNGGTGFYFAISQFFHFVDGVGAQTLGLWPAGARAAKHWQNYKLMGTISSSMPGVFVRRYIPAIQTGIDHRRLPNFYVQNAEAIAIAMREIGRRYDRINGR
jgi:hypothetical protein